MKPGRLKGGLFHGGCLIGLARASAAFDRIHGDKKTASGGLEQGRVGLGGLDKARERENKADEKELTAGRMSIEENLQCVQRREYLA